MPFYVTCNLPQYCWRPLSGQTFSESVTLWWPPLGLQIYRHKRPDVAQHVNLRKGPMEKTRRWFLVIQNPGKIEVFAWINDRLSWVSCIPHLSWTGCNVLITLRYELRSYHTTILRKRTAFHIYRWIKNVNTWMGESTSVSNAYIPSTAGGGIISEEFSMCW